MFSSRYERRVWAAPAVDLTAVDAAIAAILTTTNEGHDMTTTTKTYNGWTNYETWAVKLWLDNDPGLYEQMNDLARQACADAPDDQNVPSIWTIAEAAKYRLADALKDWHEEMRPDLDASVWSDLLSAAMSEVDWHEIAENILSDDDAFPLPSQDADES